MYVVLLCRSNSGRPEFCYSTLEHTLHTKVTFDITPGIPDVLYYLPERSGASEHLVEIDETDIDSMEEHCVHLTLSDPENIY